MGILCISHFPQHALQGFFNLKENAGPTRQAKGEKNSGNVHGNSETLFNW